MSDDVAAKRRALLAQRLREQGLTATSSAPARARAAGERSPLSPAQQRMWFVQTRDPRDTTLNICVAYRFTGPLVEARLRAAFEAVVARHEILRTTYGVGEDGEPYQVAAIEAAIDWQTHEGTGTRVEVLARREFGRPFDLTTDRPLRVTLIREAPDEHVLVLVAHHICFDDDSWPVLFAEVAAFYNGRPAPAPLTVQYVDVPVPDATDVEYWRRTLTPLPEPLELPGRALAGRPSTKADRCVATVPTELAEKVETFARAHSATSFMVMLAAFEAVIHRYTAATDFVIAVPVTNRPAAAEALIGYYGNSVLLRADVDPAASFTDLVAATREAASGAFAHQEVGIDRVIREVNPNRAAGRDGMAQLVALSFSARGSSTGPALDDITAVETGLGASVAQEPLAFMLVRTAEGYHVEAEYWVDVLDRSLVEQLVTSYVTLLDEALADPDRRIGGIDLLGDQRRADLVAASLGEAVDTPVATLTALFEDQVATNPDRTAISSDTVELTYAGLDRRANRLAHWLIGNGVGTEDVVALQFPTSVEFLVAMLAVLKAGAAYLPIDPGYPFDRIAYLEADARPVLRLDPPSFAAAEADCIDLPETAPTDAERVRLLHPGNLAYVIYTSGSTGQPKGVPVSHAAIAEHIAGFSIDSGMTAEDRLLQSSSVSFDASMFDIFVTLAAGAAIIVPKPQPFQDIPYVADLIARKRVTVLHMVPSMLATFLMLPDASQWRALRYVPVGGEALSGEVADRFAGLFDAELRNHYGPTEAVVASTRMLVDEPFGARIVPIGTPTPNVALYLLDSSLHLVPTGVVGEIYLGGNQLARGYHDRSALTAERFVADPFNPGGRLYRTGDLARRGADGNIEFVGRADEQVKIRGFRIELGEVEAAIASHPSVGHCVVIATQTDTLGAALAAYVVPDGEEVIVQQLRAHTSAVLPEHMVPAAFAVIDEVPLTAHGKLDRRALPEPILMVAREYRAPTTPTERRVAALFGRIFGKERVGADDSFFELGGHSLLAARLVTQIRAEFGIEIDVRVPFDTPTVAGLAAHVVAVFKDEFEIDLDEEDEEILPETASNRPILAEHERPEDIPLSYSQLAMWFQYRLEGPSDVGNIPFAVRIDGPLDVSALTDAISDVVARHQALRTVFAERAGVPSQIVRPSEPVELPVTAIAADELDAALATVATYTFDLESGPLLRAQLFVLDDNQHVLSVLAHHMVADHGSFGVFLADLATAYRARLSGTAPDWPPLPIAYADYALWQRDLLASEFGADELTYWRDTLSGLPDAIEVAHDHPRPLVLGKEGEVVTFTVPTAVRNGLKALADESGASEFMLCQAAVVTALHKLGGGDDIAIGTPIAGRVDENTTDLIGLYANMVVLRNDVSGNPSLRTVLQRGRDSSLGAYGHQELPIERLVEALNPKRTRSRNPLFQVMLHFRDREQTVDLAGETTLSMLPVDFDISFLDINISFAIDPDGGIAVRLVVSKDLYEPATARLMADTLASVFDALAATPDLSVDDLDILSDAERTRVLDAWANGTAKPTEIEGACTATDPAELARRITDESPAVVAAEPAVLANIALAGLSVAPSVRRWIVTGPVVPQALRELLTALAPESTVTQNYSLGEARFVDGRPVAGVRALVLDQHRRPVPHGVTGDLYVAAAEGDIDDPYLAGGRLRRTGERARWSADGALVFAAAPVEVPRSVTASGSGAPVTETERILVSILEELLEIEDVERDDNFFGLGGDSVISIQWSGRAANLGLPLTPQLIFEHMTIAELAAAVDDAMHAEPEPQDDFEAEPMSASGLTADALSALGAAWKAK